MKIQKLYIVTGLIWGLVLSPDAGLAAAGVMGQVSWLYTFQDGAWANFAIAAFGFFIGLFVLTACIQIGAYGGRRYDDRELRSRSHIKSIPWALIAVGIAVGTITALTIEDRQRAVFDYLEKQQAAADRLLKMARNLPTISGYGFDWPGGSETGKISFAFVGKERGEYLLEWGLFTENGKEPLLGEDYRVRVGTVRKTTDIPVTPHELGNAWLKQSKNPAANLEQEEPFRLVFRLTPILRAEDWELLPEGEEYRLDTGESVLIEQVTFRFKLRMRLRGGRVEWLGK